MILHWFVFSLPSKRWIVKIFYDCCSVVHLQLLCSGGAVNQWANSSLPYGATSNHVDYCSLPTSWPNSTESGFRFVPDLRGQQPTSGLGQTGLRSMAGAGMPIPRQNSIAIPLSVANASVDGRWRLHILSL